MNRNLAMLDNDISHSQNELIDLLIVLFTVAIFKSPHSKALSNEDITVELLSHKPDCSAIMILMIS